MMKKTVDIIRSTNYPNDRLSISLFGYYYYYFFSCIKSTWSLNFYECLKCRLNQYSHCPLAWWMGWKSSSCTISYGVEEEEEGDPGRSGHSMLVVVCCWSIRPGCSVSQKTALGLESASRRDGWVPCHCVLRKRSRCYKRQNRTHLGEADPVQLTHTKKPLCRSPFLNRAMIFPPEPERRIPDYYQATDEKLIMTAFNKQCNKTMFLCLAGMHSIDKTWQ